MTDNGVNVTLALTEDVELESFSPQQLMLEAIDRALPDKEVDIHPHPYRQRVPGMESAQAPIVAAVALPDAIPPAPMPAAHHRQRLGAIHH